MGSSRSGGYAASPSSVKVLKGNIEQLAKRYPLTAGGRFGRRGRNAQVVESDDPAATARQFWAALSKGGQPRPLPNGRGQRVRFDDDSLIVFRPRTTTAGSPAVEISIASPGLGFPPYQNPLPEEELGTVNRKLTSTHLDAESVRLLASVVGEKWRFITGEPLPERPGSLAAFDEVAIAFEGASLMLRSELGVLDFEGFKNEYPKLSVRAADPDLLEDARHSGRLTFLNRGELVRRVFIVREEITSLRNDQVQWVYSTDIGVIFEVAGAAVGIVKASHHIEALHVSFAASIEELDLPDRTIEWDWDNELGEEYETSRDFIDVSDYPEPQSGAPHPDGRGQ
jgi:hypothetical protein